MLLTDDNFVSGGLPRETYINPRTIVSIRYADIRCEEGRLTETTTKTIAQKAAGYLGVS